MNIFRRLSLPRTIVSLLSAALLLLWGSPVYAVLIATPKDNSQVKGVVRITASPDKGEEGFAYAILLVDNERHSITNVHPLRFEVDTADLADGAHLLQIELADRAGLLAKSKTTRFIVANQLPGRIADSTLQLPTATTAPSVAAKTQAVTRPASGSALTVVIDGKPLPSVEPVIEKGRTMVLLRPLVESMGGTIDWDPVKRQVIAEVDGRQYFFPIGEKAVMVDGKSTPIDRPSVIVAGWTVVPITIWRDVFDGDVLYDHNNRRITLKSSPHQTMPEATIASIR